MSASQAGRRGFDSRLPLQFSLNLVQVKTLPAFFKPSAVTSFQTLNLIKIESQTDLNMNIYADYLQYNDFNIYKIALKTELPYINIMVGSSYSGNAYRDFSYGLGFYFRNWEVIFGSLTHENPALGTPQCFEIRKYF